MCFVLLLTPFTITSSCYTETLDNLQKKIHSTVGPSLVASLKHLAHCRNIHSPSLFSTSITLIDIHLN